MAESYPALRASENFQELQQALEETENGIQHARRYFNGAVRVMNECSGEMESSVQQSSNANSSMEEIQAIITMISDMSSQIASAAEEQQATSAEISSNINRISEIADSNYEGIQEVANTSQVLDQLAVQQKTLVQRFHL